MPQPAPTAEGTLRQIRIIHLVLMASIVVEAQAMSLIPPQHPQSLTPALYWALCCLGAVDLGFGQFMRTRLLRTAFEKLHSISDDAPSLKRWRTGVLIGDCLALAVVLYGLVIHTLGGTKWQVAPFFIMGSVMMLIWWPKRP